MKAMGINQVLPFFFCLAFFACAPESIFVVDKAFERPIQVETPQGLTSIGAKECGKCHEAIYREWSESMHAKAWVEPYFQRDYQYDGSRQICLNCHTPLENQQENLVVGFRDKKKFDPVLNPNPAYDPMLRDEGVTCAVCHIRDGKIVGPFEPDAAPHPVVVDRKISSGMKPCVRCHVVSGKRWNTFYGTPPCGTVAEIKKGGQVPDCIGCHMPGVLRPVAKGMENRRGRKHLFQGGHSPEMVIKDLKVEYQKEAQAKSITYSFTLENVGTFHDLPTGTPDRHLTLEIRLLDQKDRVIKEKTYRMKRYFLWRPLIIEYKDTRLPYRLPKTFTFKFRPDPENPPSKLDVTVRYHLLDEARREKIGYENREPIAYPIYRKMIQLSATQP